MGPIGPVGPVGPYTGRQPPLQPKIEPQPANCELLQQQFAMMITRYLQFGLMLNPAASYAGDYFCVPFCGSSLQMVGKASGHTPMTNSVIRK